MQQNDIAPTVQGMKGKKMWEQPLHESLINNDIGSAFIFWDFTSLLMTLLKCVS